MTSSYFELICIVLLGLGHMCVFIGNDAQTFLVESVMHSVNGRQPDRIDAHAVFYTGYGSYLTAHSTRKTIEQNSAVMWSIGNLW
ncbi:hypothetical protein ANCDUO_09430 [Ancylostoma duodenale]|uniref:Uncharacterized protein n=1 Tax=Ancylostoma duodenale TaxID=51022 RepID=A0A0C2GMW3_9BILA|nr:hypothetical protein ANCDUO_09430 [Ancylostoma duodenale]